MIDIVLNLVEAEAKFLGVVGIIVFSSLLSSAVMSYFSTKGNWIMTKLFYLSVVFQEDHNKSCHCRKVHALHQMPLHKYHLSAH